MTLTKRNNINNNNNNHHHHHHHHHNNNNNTSYPENILKNPSDKKLRKIKTTNAYVTSRVLGARGGASLLCFGPCAYRLQGNLTLGFNLILPFIVLSCCLHHSYLPLTKSLSTSFCLFIFRIASVCVASHCVASIMCVSIAPFVFNQSMQRICNRSSVRYCCLPRGGICPEMNSSGHFDPTQHFYGPPLVCYMTNIDTQCRAWLANTCLIVVLFVKQPIGVVTLGRGNPDTFN